MDRTVHSMHYSVSQKSDVQSDHQNLCVNYDTAVYTSKERLHNKNEVAYCINNNAILLNTEHGFVENKTLQVAVSNNYANCMLTGNVEIVK